MIDDAVSLAELEARNQKATIRLTIDSELPQVYADPILIEQVLMNLIKNAMDAMRLVDVSDRFVDISATLHEKMIEVAVADRGHGVPEHLKEKLFESFFSTKSDGMGMGLNICRTIIEFHEGRLWVSSNNESGSIFRFILPLVTEERRSKYNNNEETA